MVEGHSVHRIAVAHTRRLCGRSFKATSPNGRFSDGARLINGRSFSRIEAIGKNLFAFFAAAGQPDVVVHVHFGMSGRWSLVDAGRRRLRPILLTTTTTVLGLTPLMLEPSFQARFLVPMAISITWGLMSSTILTLLVLPAILVIVDDIAGAFHWLWFGMTRADRRAGVDAR